MLFVLKFQAIPTLSVIKSSYSHSLSGGEDAVVMVSSGGSNERAQTGCHPVKGEERKNEVKYFKMFRMQQGKSTTELPGTKGFSRERRASCTPPRAPGAWGRCDPGLGGPARSCVLTSHRDQALGFGCAETPTWQRPEVWK